MNKPFTFLLFVLLNLHAIGQDIYSFSQKLEPEWIHKLPQSDKFEYYLGFGEHDTLSKAQKLSEIDVVNQIAKENNLTVDISSKSEINSRENQVNDDITTVINFQFNSKVNEVVRPVSINGLRKVEFYWVQIRTGSRLVYRYYVMLRKPKENRYINEPLYTFDRGHKWRSVVFPGWGQMYIGKKNKGSLFLIAGGIMAAGIITGQTLYSVSDNNYRNYIKKGDMKNAEILKSNRDNWGLIRNVGIVGFSGVYIFNIIDALTSGGNKIYSYNRKNMRISPDFQLNSIGFRINFALK